MNKLRLSVDGLGFMKSHALRVVVFIAIYGTVFGSFYFSSGAPTRVHVVDALALLLGFAVPAQLVSSLEDIVRKWKVILCLFVCSLVGLDYLATVVIAKKEFLFNWWLFYPIGLVFLTALLVVHGVLAGLATRYLQTSTQQP